MSLLATVYLADILMYYFSYFRRYWIYQTNKQIFDWKAPANDRVSFHDERLAVIFGAVKHTMCLLIMITTQKICETCEIIFNINRVSGEAYNVAEITIVIVKPDLGAKVN